MAQAEKLEYIVANRIPDSYGKSDYHYLATGLYADQIRQWQQYFALDDMLILQSEKLFLKPETTSKRVFEFLGLQEFEVDTSVKHNVGNYGAMKPQTREWLIDFFKPRNARLYELLGTQFDWDK